MELQWFHWVAIICFGFFMLFNIVRLSLNIARKIKNKKYEADQREGRDEREN